MAENLTPLEKNTQTLAEIKTMVESLPEAGGGTDISLGITSAAVGDIVKVKAVDENGKPTEWEAAGGSDLKWIDVISLTTAEETNTISISTDTEGREISEYHALAMTISAVIPADETQTAATGNVIIQPMFFSTGISLEIGNAYRVVVALPTWKTVKRAINGVFQGGKKAFYGICNNYFTGVGVPNSTYTGEIFNGLTIRVQATEGHLPIGVKVNVAVLSRGWTA